MYNVYYIRVIVACCVQFGGKNEQKNRLEGDATTGVVGLETQTAEIELVMCYDIDMTGLPETPHPGPHMTYLDSVVGCRYMYIGLKVNRMLL